MTKYFFNEDKTTGKELWLALIANELAEANRLKRIEIEAIIFAEEIRTTTENQEKFAKDLKDQV